MAHTPGPWTVRTIDDLCISVISDGNKVVPALCYGLNREANARLIAAAPDLLRLLRSVCDYSGGCLEQHKTEYNAATVEAYELLNRLGG